jgi:hypothetical protein
MPFTLTCPECHDRSEVPDEVAGKRVRCRRCQAVFRAGSPDVDVVDDDRPRRRPSGADESRSRKRDRDDEDELSRQRRDEDDRDDDRPRGKPARGKAGGKKKAKKKRGVGYFVGLAAALVLAGGALTFVAWKAGAFGPKTEKGVILDADGQAAYVPPDERIKSPKPAGDVKLQLGSPPPQKGDHVRLSDPIVEGGTLVVNYQFLGQFQPGPGYVLVVVYQGGWEIKYLDQLVQDAGNFKLNVPTGRIEVWVGKTGRNAGPADPGSRVSNVVTYN